MKIRKRFKTAWLGVAAAAALSAPMAWSAPTPEDFGQRTSVYDAAISPDGSQLALIQNLDGQYIVRVMSLSNPGEPLRAVSLGDKPKPKYIKWVNDGRVVVALRMSEQFRTNVFDSSYLYTLDTEAMDGKMLIRPKKGFRQFNDQVLDWLEDDPDHIVMQFAEDGTNQNYPDVRKVNVATGRHTNVKRQTNRVSSWVTDPDGEPRIGIGTRKRGEEFYMTIRQPGTDTWESFREYPGLDPDTQDVVAITDGGRSLVLSAYRGKNTRGLHRYDLVERRFAEPIYENPEFDVSNVILSKDGESIVGASFTGESQERVLFDSYDSTFEEALARFEGFRVDFVDQTADSDMLLLRVSAPTNPGKLVLYERGGGVTNIAENMPNLKPNDMGEVISASYKARDGQRIPAFVTLPRALAAGQSPSNMPFVVLPHGGPYARDEKRFDYLAQFFAAQGYGVLQMNFRGSEGYGKAFADAGRNNWVVMQEDVEDGMRWLLDKGYADPERTCIAGWSYGGYAALMGVAKNPDLYNCAIAIAALTDIKEAADDLKAYNNGKAMAERTFGEMLKNGDLRRANNPVDVADDITVPVFMAHGTRDTSTEFDQFTRMRRALKKAGIKGTYMEFEDEDHYMSRQANRQAMLKGIAKFLRKHNGDSEYALK